jgi:HTH-type transcriptional regulator, sugar sensing transcriptional regulator
LSQEQVLNTLSTLGFDEIHAQIYVYLAKKGAKKASDVCKTLKLTRQQFYPSIKQLQSKGIVNTTIERPARFSVIPFEQVLDVYIKDKMDEAQSLQLRKKDILANWQNLKLEDDLPAKFTVIEGRNFIYTKIQQMIQETRNQILVITTVPVLAQANERDIFDLRSDYRGKTRSQFRFLTELNHQNIHIMKALLNEIKGFKFAFEGRNPDLGVTPFPQMFARDGEEALIFVKPRTDTSKLEKEDTCLWTDCKTLVSAFAAFFEETWLNSTSLEEKIQEIETGKPTPKTLIITDAESAKKKHNEALNSANEEILILTSSQGIKEIRSSLNKKGIETKIMAPIVDDNLEDAKQLFSFCSIRHVPPNYTPTTVIDGKSLFQFTASDPRDMTVDSPLKFEKTLYVTDPEYTQKTRAMLLELWRNSSTISTDNLKSIFGSGARSQSAYFPGPIQAPGPNGTFHPLPPSDPSKKGSYSVITIANEDTSKKLKEQDVLKEFIDAQKLPASVSQTGLYKIYSTQAVAILHLPEYFNLPSMLLRIHHIEKQSAFGPEDTIIINLWLELRGRQAYIPVAVFSDRPNAQTVWGRHFEATPASRNIQVAKKDELRVLIHGNTLFAGWTVPIQLFPSEYVLPPACILLEGYGIVKTEAYSVIQPSGGSFKAKQNGFDAFVTFMHPSSKYSGSGTNGFLVRDFVMELNPQFMEGFHPTLETKLLERDDKE